VLPSGELEVGDQRVPLDADHKDQIEDLLEQLVEGQQRLEERIERGEAQLAERDEKLSAKEGELEELKTELEKARTSGSTSDPVARAMMAVHMAVMEVKQLIEDEEPEREVVLKFYRLTAPHWKEVLEYGANWQPYDDDEDPLAKIVRGEMGEGLIVREEDEGGGAGEGEEGGGS
jgi:hypothetical protein